MKSYVWQIPMLRDPEMREKRAGRRRFAEGVEDDHRAVDDVLAPAIRDTGLHGDAQHTWLFQAARCLR